MPDYSKGLIYKLCCKDANITDIYIGSTTNFKQRKGTHKRSCNNEKDKAYNIKVYKCIRENGGFENWEMIQIKTVNANDKRDLEAEERLVIEELKPSLNCYIPTRTEKERGVAYYKANRDDIIARQKAYTEANRDAIRAYHKAYAEANADALNSYSKAYYEANRDDIIARRKAYNEANRDAISAKKKAYYQRKKQKEQ